MSSTTLYGSSTKTLFHLLAIAMKFRKKHVKYNGKLVLADKIYRLLCFEYMQNGNLGKYLSGMTVPYI